MLYHEIVVCGTDSQRDVLGWTLDNRGFRGHAVKPSRSGLDVDESRGRQDIATKERSSHVFRGVAENYGGLLAAGGMSCLTVWKSKPWTRLAPTPMLIPLSAEERKI